MQVTLPDKLKLQERARAAGYTDVETYLIDLVERDQHAEEYIVEPSTRRVLTRDELKAELQKGIDSINAGKSLPLDLDQVRRDLHERHGQTAK
ncbi:hypothetical protein [Calycomorphotria hydatis]|uniref:Uncharacterized protein n=1 Tax=Calycomorphotria hydatis TaxID=2528027 RepID=A0A517T5P0_9PLAN|nr:hypothetical protein [Calycomorphotria hydatis]QDT63690.1 hypothetical protein V22_09150 [Calycomorphotria hydatis]